MVSSVLGAISTGEEPGEVTIRPLRPPQRARLLEKWIRVAEVREKIGPVGDRGVGEIPQLWPPSVTPQECRLLRNFSSVYAVVSALQSSPIHRLRTAWGEAARWGGWGTGLG